jgi:hypothetical protein
MVFSVPNGRLWPLRNDTRPIGAADTGGRGTLADRAIYA